MNTVTARTSVFVYGTLKDGKGNAVLLRGADFVGRGMTIKPYTMFDTGGFPVVFQEQPNANVQGEVYDVSDEILARLDRLEGHPDFFERREIEVDIGDTGVYHTCWMYFGQHETWEQRIPSLSLVVPHNGAYDWGV